MPASIKPGHKLYFVYGYIPGIGDIEKKTQAKNEREALRNVAHFFKKEFGIPREQRLYLGNLIVEKRAP